MQGGNVRWWQTRWFVIAAVLAAAVPLIWPNIPPLVDLPGHLARYRVQLSSGQYPWFRDWYDFRWSLIGNLGIDLIIVPIAPMLGLELTVKLTVIAIPMLTVSGLLWIAREVHGRIPPTALFALPLAYSYPFQFGFVNFALSMAIALNLFALWLRMARLGRLRLRAIVFVPASCALWVCHTYGWGFLGVLAFSAEMIRQHDLRKDGRGGHWIESWLRAGLACVPLALPIVLMVFWRTGDDVTGQTADWFNWRAKIAWITMVLRDRWEVFDLASTAVLYIVLLKGFRDPGIEYSRNLGLSALFLALVYTLLPRIVFGSAYADMRLAPYAIAIAIIAIRPKAGATMRRATLLAALGLSFFLVRIGAATVSYLEFDRDYDTELAALDTVPIGARLVTFVGHSCRNEWRMSRLEHIPAMALVRRGAYTNDQWSMAGAQLLTVRYRDAGRFAHDPSQIVTAVRCSGEWWRPVSRAVAQFPRDAFDYVWMVRTPPVEEKYRADLIPIWRSARGDSVVYRVDRTKPAPQFSDASFLPRRI